MSIGQRVGELVTPVLLTFDEEPNIRRALEGLTWAAEVVVVDSGSSDNTEPIARSFSNVRWLVRPFDNHAAQWTFAVQSAAARSPYVLALDADYQVPEAFVRELEERFVRQSFEGGVAGFDYRIGGRTLMGSVYPRKLVLFRPEHVRIGQPGHTQELWIDGPLYQFEARLVHDDRKPIDRFFQSQLEYARLEAARLGRERSTRWQDRVRRLGVMPLLAGIGAYARSGGPWRGSAALRYGYERMMFECLLALRLLNDTNEKDGRVEEPRNRR